MTAAAPSGGGRCRLRNPSGTGNRSRNRAVYAVHRHWEDRMKYGLLWLLGVPVPVLIVIYFLFH